MTSQQAQLQALINEIKALLGRTTPKLPWVMSGEANQQRQVMERALTYLQELEDTNVLSPGWGVLSGQGAIAPADESGEPTVNSPEATSQQVLRALLQEMQYLRAQMVQPLTNEIVALQQQREALKNEVRQLELARLEAADQPAAPALNPASVNEIVGQLKASLLEQLAPQIRALQAQAGELTMPDVAARDPQEIEADLPQLSPQQRLEQLQQIQAQTDAMLLSLDANLRAVFESFEQSIQSYSDTLSRGLSDMHGLGQQGEFIFRTFIEQLVQQLPQNLSYLTSRSRDATRLRGGDDSLEDDENAGLYSSENDSIDSGVDSDVDLDRIDLDDIDLDDADSEEVTLFQLDEDITRLPLDDEDADLDLDSDDDSDEEKTVVQTEPIAWEDAIGLRRSSNVGDGEAAAPTDGAEEGADNGADEAPYDEEIDALYDSLFGQTGRIEGDTPADVDEDLSPAIAEETVDESLLYTDSELTSRDTAEDASAGDLADPSDPELADTGLADGPENGTDSEEAAAVSDQAIADEDLSETALEGLFNTTDQQDSSPLLPSEAADEDESVGSLEQLLGSEVAEELTPSGESTLESNTIASLSELLPDPNPGNTSRFSDPFIGLDDMGDAFIPAPPDEDLLSLDPEESVSNIDLSLNDETFGQLSDDLSRLEGLPAEASGSTRPIRNLDALDSDAPQPLAEEPADSTVELPEEWSETSEESPMRESQTEDSDATSTLDELSLSAELDELAVDGEDEMVLSDLSFSDTALGESTPLSVDSSLDEVSGLEETDAVSEDIVSEPAEPLPPSLDEAAIDDAFGDSDQENPSTENELTLEDAFGDDVSGDIAATEDLIRPEVDMAAEEHAVDADTALGDVFGDRLQMGEATDDEFVLEGVLDDEVDTTPLYLGDDTAEENPTLDNAFGESREDDDESSQEAAGDLRARLSDYISEDDEASAPDAIGETPSDGADFEVAPVPTTFIDDLEEDDDLSASLEEISTDFAVLSDEETLTEPSSDQQIDDSEPGPVETTSDITLEDDLFSSSAESTSDTEATGSDREFSDIGPSTEDAVDSDTLQTWSSSMEEDASDLDIPDFEQIDILDPHDSRVPPEDTEGPGDDSPGAAIASAEDGSDAAAGSDTSAEDDVFSLGNVELDLSLDLESDEAATAPSDADAFAGWPDAQSPEDPDLVPSADVTEPTLEGMPLELSGLDINGSVDEGFAVQLDESLADRVFDTLATDVPPYDDQWSAADLFPPVASEGDAAIADTVPPEASLEIAGSPETGFSLATDTDQDTVESVFATLPSADEDDRPTTIERKEFPGPLLGFPEAYDLPEIESTERSQTEIVLPEIAILGSPESGFTLDVGDPSDFDAADIAFDDIPDADSTNIAQDVLEAEYGGLADETYLPANPSATSDAEGDSLVSADAFPFASTVDLVIPDIPEFDPDRPVETSRFTDDATSQVGGSVESADPVFDLGEESGLRLTGSVDDGFRVVSPDDSNADDEAHQLDAIAHVIEDAPELSEVLSTEGDRPAASAAIDTIDIPNGDREDEALSTVDAPILPLEGSYEQGFSIADDDTVSPESLERTLDFSDIPDADIAGDTGAPTMSPEELTADDTQDSEDFAPTESIGPLSDDELADLFPPQAGGAEAEEIGSADGDIDALLTTGDRNSALDDPTAAPDRPVDEDDSESAFAEGAASESPGELLDVDLEEPIPSIEDDIDRLFTDGPELTAEAAASSSSELADDIESFEDPVIREERPTPDVEVAGAITDEEFADLFPPMTDEVEQADEDSFQESEADLDHSEETAESTADSIEGMADQTEDARLPEADSSPPIAPSEPIPAAQDSADWDPLATDFDLAIDFDINDLDLTSDADEDSTTDADRPVSPLIQDVDLSMEDIPETEIENDEAFQAAFQNDLSLESIEAAAADDEVESAGLDDWDTASSEPDDEVDSETPPDSGDDLDAGSVDNPVLEATIVSETSVAEAEAAAVETDADTDVDVVVPRSSEAVDAEAADLAPAETVARRHDTEEITEESTTAQPSVPVETDVDTTADAALFASSGALSVIPDDEVTDDEPPAAEDVPEPEKEWFLGIDFGASGLSAVLMNPASGSAHPLYWSAASESGTDKSTFRIPAIAALDSDAAVANSDAVGLSALPDDADASAPHLLTLLKPLLKTGVAYPTATGDQQPVIQWADDQTIPLQSVLDGAAALLASMVDPQGDLYLESVGLEEHDLHRALNALQGVVVGHPSHWSDTYRINMREAVLTAGLVETPSQVFFVEEAIAAVLSGLPDPSEPPSPQNRRSQALYQCDWQGGTVVISGGASCTEIGLAELPRPLDALSREDFTLRNLAYGGDAFDLDVICQLLVPSERRHTISPGDRRSARTGWSWQAALPDVTNAQWDSLDLSSIPLPQLAEPDIATRVRLRQHLEASRLGQSLLEAARYLKLILQNQNQSQLELADQSWKVLRRDLESRVIVPYIQRLNQQLNALLSQTGMSSQGINQVICTGGNASFNTIAKWLRQKFPNATIIQDTYPTNRTQSCSRVAYGLANLCRYPQMLDVPRHQYSDYFLLHEIVRVVPETPFPLNGILHLLEEQGINTEVCQSRIRAILEGHLPPGLIPDSTTSPYLSSATLEHPSYRELAAGSLFVKQTRQIYMMNPQQRDRIRDHLSALMANKQQSLAEPMIAQLVTL